MEKVIKKYALEKMTDDIYEIIIKNIKKLVKEYEYEAKDVLETVESKYYFEMWDEINDKLINILGE